MLKDYYALAKPGLVYGNLITVIAGFLTGEVALMAGVLPAGAVSAGIDFTALFTVIIGMAFVMGSGCVFNNVIDRNIDGAMGRTKDRALVIGRISRRAALIYGTCLAIAGFAALAIWTTFLAVLVACAGFFVYVIAYSMWAKRRTAWSTVVGSVAGAMPPVVGYCAATGRFDLGAALLFAILVLWQMPHFYSIAIYRRDDYATAGVPVLPVRKGTRTTKIAMLLYIIAFALVAPLLAVFGYVGHVYFIIAILLSLVWLTFCIKGFWNSAGGGNTTQTESAVRDRRWARKMFFISLAVMTTLFIVLTADQVMRIFFPG